MRNWTYWLVSALLLSAGCAPNEAANPVVQDSDVVKAEDGLVLAVGGGKLTSKEVIESIIERDGMFLALPEIFRPIAQSTGLQDFKEQARAELEQLVERRIANILLYQCARRQFQGERFEKYLDMVADQEAKELVMREFGGDSARARAYLEERGMDWDSYKEAQKKKLVNQWYIAEHLPKATPVAHAEVLDRYNQVKDELFAVPAAIKFGLIDIEPEKLRLGDPKQDRLERSRELAAEMIAQIRTGKDLSRLAEGRPGVSFIRFNEAVQPDSLAKPYDILAAEAEKIQSGEVTSPIETGTGDHIFIMKLDERRPRSVEPLENVQKRVEEMILAERRRQAVDELEAKFAQQAKLAEKGRFIDFCLEEIYGVSNQ